MIRVQFLGLASLGLLVASCTQTSANSAVGAAGASAATGGRLPTGGDTASGGATTATGGSSAAGTTSGNTAPLAGNGLASTSPSGVIAGLRVRDGEGNEYDAVGRPVSGGESLEPLVGYNQFWFAWSVFNHDSLIFGHDHRVESGEITGDGTCAVPCDHIVFGCPGQDCIPALTAPEFVASDAPESDYVSDTSWVVGVAHGGEARAYPHNILWWHEIVNDTVGGEPIAVTHCPLTFSTIGHDPTAFNPGATVELGVSGLLYNSNLVFYDRNDGTRFSQLLGVAVRDGDIGTPAPRVHVWEMSWAAWKELYPETLVMSVDTGHARNYESYPYGGYFVNDANTFSTTRPPPDPTYPNKAITYGLRVGGDAKAYAHSELAAWAAEQYGSDAPAAGVVNDTVGDVELAIVFDIDAGYVQAFDRTGKSELGLVQ